MNNIDIPPFFIGEEVVAIKNHSQGAFKKGDEFPILWIGKKCCVFMVDIGIIDKERPFFHCCDCYTTLPDRSGKWYFASYLFRRKHNYGEFISMKEFADKQLETIGAH